MKQMPNNKESSSGRRRKIVLGNGLDNVCPDCKQYEDNCECDDQ